MTKSRQHLLTFHTPTAAARATGWLVSIALLAMGSVAAAQQADKGRKTYRWVDERGIVHYGDRIPPEYIRGEAAELNKQAVPVVTYPAQKTPEQVARDAEAKAITDRQKQHDTFLLTTYQSVRDIERLRDERLEQMAATRRASQLYVESLDGRLETLHARAQTFRPYNTNAGARRMPDELAEDLVRTLNEVRAQNSQLQIRLNEEKSLREQFQQDIDRFRKLKTAAMANNR
jgi:hypothetical protein